MTGPGAVRDAQDAFATVMCRQYGCVREADPGLTLCSEHRNRREYGTVSEARLELAAEVKRLREVDGLMWREIGERLGISPTYAQTLHSDPDGAKSRVRKDSYSQACLRCGAPVSGAEGPKKVADFCASCFNARQHEDRYWTRETIIATFQRFHAVNGRSPATTDAMVGAPSIDAKLSDARIAEAKAAVSRAPLPDPWVVAREFESWHLALAAAGLPSNPRGGAARRGPHAPKGVTLARVYHVLHRNGDGGLHEQVIEALSAEQAIEKVADREGEWIAVLDSAWFAAPVEPRNIFAVVKS